MVLRPDPDSDSPAEEPLRKSSVEFAPYHAKEVKHQLEISRLEAEIKERKMLIEQKIDQDYRIYKRRLEEAVEKLQRQCEDVELRYRGHRQKLEAENANFEPRLREVMKHLAEMESQEREKGARTLQAAKAEVEELQSLLARLSAKIAKQNGEIGVLRSEVDGHDDAKGRRLDKLDGEVLDARRQVQEKTRGLEDFSKGMERDLAEKDQQLSEALAGLDDSLRDKQSEVDETERQFQQTIVDMKSEIEETKRAGRKLDQEVPRKVLQVKQEVEELQSHLQAPDTNEDASTKRLLQISDRRIREEEDKLRHKQESLSGMQSELHRKLAELKALLSSFDGKKSEVDSDQLARMDDLRKKYEQFENQRRLEMKKAEEHLTETIEAYKTSFTQKQAATDAELKDMSEKIAAAEGQFGESGRSLRQNIQALKKSVEAWKADLKAAEDEHFRLVGQIKIRTEELLIQQERLQLVAERVRQDSERELKYLVQLDEANTQMLAAKIQDQAVIIGSLEEELSRTDQAVDGRKQDHLRALEEANSSAKLGREGDGAEIDRILSAIRTVKNEIREDRDVFGQEATALAETMKREKVAYAGDKERLYEQLHKEQEKQNVEADEMRQDIELALEERAHIRYTRDQQAESVAQGQVQQSLANTESTRRGLKDLEDKVQEYAKSLCEVEDQIREVSQRPEGDAEDANAEDTLETLDLKNKLYILKECARASEKPRGEQLMKEQVWSLRDSNTKLHEKISTIKSRKQELHDMMSRLSLPRVQLESALLESKMADLQKKNQSLRRKRCQMLDDWLRQLDSSISEADDNINTASSNSK